VSGDKLASERTLRSALEDGSGDVRLDVQVPKRRFQYSLRTLLLLCIPVVLFAGLGRWLFHPPPIDVVMTVKRFYWYQDMPEGRVGLAADVSITNRSRDTVWYMENPRYVLLQLVDGMWLESSTGCSLARLLGEPEQDWWLPQDGMQTVTIPVSPVSEKATVMRVAVAFTTDRFMPKRHWIFSPEIRIVKKGKDFFPEVKEGDACVESIYAPGLVERDLKNSNGKGIVTSPEPVPVDADASSQPPSKTKPKK
jgi:hypothetical protein